MCSAGVVSLLTVVTISSSSLFNNSGFIVTTLSPFGCIRVFTTVSTAIIATTINIVCISKMLSAIGIGEVRAPCVISVNALLPVDIDKGIDPDNPACHTTNPLYADDISRR